MVESTESEEIPFRMVNYFICVSRKTNPKMSIYLVLFDMYPSETFPFLLGEIFLHFEFDLGQGEGSRYEDE